MNLMSSKPEFPEETTRSSPMFFSGDSHSDPASPVATGAVTVKEHMFYKVVTPSDVGKLNRLVVPKHHAEKYFPLDSSTNEKGLVLDFEDRNGKPWRFRYSYWNSSQSYVMTKGWSRFVKEKNLDAGDTVSFHRAGKNGRFFIDWSRRSDHPPRVHTPNHRLSFDRPNMIHPLYLQANHYHPYCNNIVVVGNPCRPSSVVYPGLFPGASGGATAAFGTSPVVESKGEGKRLRLFGVNMDCSVSESDHQYEDDILPILSLDSSSSSSSVRSLQLRPYNSDNYNHSKGKGSISLDLDI